MSHIFISYSHDDTDYVRELATFLQANHFAVWFDDHIKTGEDWQFALSSAIQKSSLVVVVMSESGHDSEWIGRELQLALKHSRPILPILLDGEPFQELHLYQYIEVIDRQMPPPEFLYRLREIVRPNSSYYIDYLITRLEIEKKFVEQGRQDDLFTAYPAYLGMFVRLITFEISAVGLISADHLSPSEIAAVHSGFVEYLTAWKPENPLGRAVKKRGVMCFVFEESMPQDLIQTIRSQRYDSEASGLGLVDGVRTVSWAINLGQSRVEAQTGLLDILPPATADFYPGRKWLQQQIPPVL